MDDNNDLEKIRQVLRLARDLINQNKQELGLEHLRKIRSLVEQYAGSRESVEFPLVLAEAHLKRGDKDATGSYLREAKVKLERLPSADPDLERRVMKQLGDMYRRERKFGLAQDYYARAKAAAVKIGVPELIADMQLRLILVEIQGDCQLTEDERRTQEANFRTLRRAGNEGSFTCDEQVAAWHLYIADRAESLTGVRFARQFSRVESVDDVYFLRLLNSVRAGNS